MLSPTTLAKLSPPCPEPVDNGPNEDAAAATTLGPAEITTEDILTNNHDAKEAKKTGAGGSVGDDIAGLKLPVVVDSAKNTVLHLAVAASKAAAPAAYAVAVDVAVTAAAPPASIPFASSDGFQFGIPEATLLAPVPPPPKKKRKTQDEFTIFQKLEILSELKGPSAVSVPILAAKHNTSRTSIYRWKKDMPRLQKLAKKDGKGQSKRVSHKRKLYNEEYTAAEKLAVVRELQGENALSVRALSEKLGTNHRSIYRWKKDEARLIKLVERDGLGTSKRVCDDPLLRIKEGLKLFHANQYMNATVGEQRQRPLTGTMIATKARQVRDDMLAQHELTPFLTDEEFKGMKEFTGSTSWGRKIVNKFGWKINGSKPTAAAAAASGTDTMADSINLDDIALPASPLAATVTTPAAASSAAAATKKEANKKPPHLKVNEMKLEIKFLKKRLHGTEARANSAETRAINLGMENAELRAHIRMLMNNDSNVIESGSGVATGGMATESGLLAKYDDPATPAINNTVVLGIDEGALSALADGAVAEEGDVNKGDTILEV